MSLHGEDIKDLALKLTKVASIVGTAGENAIAQTIHDYFAALAYFRTHPENLQLIPLKNDPLGRCTVLAYIEGNGKSPQKPAANNTTLLLLGHIDTAGIEDYGELKEWATHPEELKKRLLAIQFQEEIKAEIESPDWLLGRGIFDMKAGVAAQMVMLADFSERLDEIQGNLVFIGVPDEEGNSAGMISVIAYLQQLAKERHWDFAATINTDYMTTRYPGDENKYVYIGTVGKLLPCFYVYGEETHVGEAFNGLDANLLASEIIRQIDMNTELCDIADGEVSQPPISLKQRDLKKEYSVQTTNAVSVYFNHATHKSQPTDVLIKYKENAAIAFTNVINRLNHEYHRFCQLSNIPYQKLPWEVQVLTYDELYRAVKKEIGAELDQRIEQVVRNLLAEKADDREISLAIVEETHKNYSNQNSKIILYFAPPYYPHVFVNGYTEKESKLLNTVKKVVSEAQQRYPYKIQTKKFYPYISDLSYCSISHNDDIIAALTANMPAWSRSYSLPIEAIQHLSMPVVNIGPFGKDAHKLSERLCRQYSFDAMPFILEKTIEELLK